MAATRKVMLPITVAKMPARPLAGALEKALHGERAFASDEVIELADDLAAHSLGAEHHARDRRGDQQDRRDREQRVVGERRAQPRAVVVPPRAGCGADQFAGSPASRIESEVCAHGIAGRCSILNVRAGL